MQYKSLVNPSFLVLMLDVQEHFQAGWEIDPNNLPVNNFMFHEVHLIKDDVDNVFLKSVDNDDPNWHSTQPTPTRKAGRPVRKAN